MANTDADVRVRLQRAALELFAERGYDRTTAAEVAARAGVTERTFFRHFADKREVLFDGEAILRAALTAAIREAPGDLDVLDLLFLAFRSVVPAIEANRSFAMPRREIIARTPALHEREMAKTNTLADALAAALQARNIPDLRAVLAARTGMAAFAQSIAAWLDDSGQALGQHLDQVERELRLLLASSDDNR